MHAMAEQWTDFTDLLRDRRAELGRSLREMEALCIDPESGEQAKFGWLSKVERGEPVDPPKADRIKALKIGYELPLKVLHLAMFRQFYGYEPGDDPSAVWSKDLTTRVIAARAEEMTDADRRELADIAEIYARRRTQRDDDGQGNSGD